MKQGRIPQAFIDDLLDRTDIVEVIGRHVALRKSGNATVGLCPFHEECKPSFSVGGPRQCYYCFACGASGNAITFLVEHIGLSFVDAVCELATAAGSPMPTLDNGVSLSHGLIRGLVTASPKTCEPQGRAARIEADRKEQDDAAMRAAALWRQALPFIRHGYTDRKVIPTTGLRQLRGDGRSSPFYVTNNDGRIERLRGDLILVPMINGHGKLQALQAIDDTGRKSFLKGSRTRGLFFPIGHRTGIERSTFDGELGIAEGLATGWAVHRLSNMRTFVAFSAGNLKAAAHIVRNLYPQAQIFIAGDVDRSGAGQRAAQDAAAAIGGLVSLPQFTNDEIALGLTDWHDWMSVRRTSRDRKTG